MTEPFELQPRVVARLELLNCPGCDSSVSTENLALHEECQCPRCKVTLLLVSIDGVVMFLRDGWT